MKISTYYSLNVFYQGTQGLEIIEVYLPSDQAYIPVAQVQTPFGNRKVVSSVLYPGDCIDVLLADVDWRGADQGLFSELHKALAWGWEVNFDDACLVGDAFVNHYPELADKVK